MILLSVLCILSWFLVTTHVAIACATTTTWFFDSASGDDDNNCMTQETACRSTSKLQSILNQVKPGSTVSLKRGSTFKPTATLNLSASGTEDDVITITSYGDGETKPILDGSTLPGGNMIIKCKRQKHYIIQDIQFQYGKGAFDIYGCENITLDNIAIVKECAQECIRVKYDGEDHPSTDITIRNSLFDTTQRNEVIYIGTDPEKDNGAPDTTNNVVVINNTIKNGNSHECVEMKDGTHNVTVRGNFFINNTITQNACIYSSRARSTTPAGNHIIESNTFENTKGTGHPIRIRNTATLRFNVINTSTKDGIYLDQPSEHPVHTRVAENNTIVNTEEGGIFISGSKTTQKNNISWQNAKNNDTKDPMFVDLARKDYRLQRGSSALLKGINPTPIQ